MKLLKDTSHIAIIGEVKTRLVICRLFRIWPQSNFSKHFLAEKRSVTSMQAHFVLTRKEMLIDGSFKEALQNN